MIWYSRGSDSVGLWPQLAINVGTDCKQGANQIANDILCMPELLATVVTCGIF